MNTVSLQDIHKMLKAAISAGVQDYIRETDPCSDRIKQSEANRYVRRMGFQPTLIDKLTAAGMLHPVKACTAQNGAVWYSLAEVKSAIASIRIGEVLNK